MVEVDGGAYVQRRHRPQVRVKGQVIVKVKTDATTRRCEVACASRAVFRFRPSAPDARCGAPRGDRRFTENLGRWIDRDRTCR